MKWRFKNSRKIPKTVPSRLKAFLWQSSKETTGCQSGWGIGEERGKGWGRKGRRDSGWGRKGWKSYLIAAAWAGLQSERGRQCEWCCKCLTRTTRPKKHQQQHETKISAQETWQSRDVTWIAHVTILTGEYLSWCVMWPEANSTWPLLLMRKRNASIACKWRHTHTSDWRSVELGCNNRDYLTSNTNPPRLSWPRMPGILDDTRLCCRGSFPTAKR